jgi:hypothetical protein
MGRHFGNVVFEFSLIFGFHYSPSFACHFILKFAPVLKDRPAHSRCVFLKYKRKQVLRHHSNLPPHASLGLLQTEKRRTSLQPSEKGKAPAQF